MRAEFTTNQIRILDAAAEEFMISGFDATSVDAIATRIGQTKGLVYYHFRSKVEIFYAVYERGVMLLTDDVAPHATGPGSALDRLRRMARAHQVNLMDFLAYHDTMRQGIEQRLRMRLTETQRRNLTELHTLRDDYESLFRKVISEGVTQGSVRELPVTVAARTLLGGLNAVAVWYRYKDDQAPTDKHVLATLVADQLVDGLRA